MKNKNIKIISLIISIILIIAVGTYAWLTWSSQQNTDLYSNVGNLLEVKFTTGNDINATDMLPTLDPLTNGEVTTFSVKNRATYDYAIDIVLNITSISTELKSESFKYIILSSDTENGEYTSVASGDFTNMVVGDNTIGGEVIPKKATKYFKFIVYIDGSVENNSNVMGKALSGELNVTAHENEPNPPALVDGLIPVKYDKTNETWVKADSTNTNNDWYNYKDKKWANAVLVSDTNRNSYINGSVGTQIPESDVLAYYVWIPRYKYRVWNINKDMNMTNNLNAKDSGIDILFENNKESTGTISCNYDFTITDGSLSEICRGSNSEYYTHPAFSFGNDEVTGFWVGKFEISSETPDVLTSNNYYGGGNVTNLTVRIKPNVRSWRNNTVTNFYKVIYDMQIENNIYGLNTSRSNTDSHMLKNMEWGAVAYLTNSKYGRCTNNTCTEVTINNSSDYITGNAGISVSASQASGTTNAYDTTAGQLASTTGNIYGIYDMSGGAYEYVMGNMSSAAGSYTYYASSGGSNYSYTGNEKYIDTYANGSSNTDQTAMNRSRLGDATGETKSWYSDYAYFVYSTTSWFDRGGYYSAATSAGPFSFSSHNGGSSTYYSARLALLSTSN